MRWLVFLVAVLLAGPPVAAQDLYNPPTISSLGAMLNDASNAVLPTARRSGLLAMPTVNARDPAYGMKCDNSTDDAAALQAAATAAASAGGNVTISGNPSGAVATCLLGSPVTWPTGVGFYTQPGTVILKARAGNVGSVLLWATGGSNIYVYGLTFDGGGKDFANANNVTQLYGGGTPVDNVIFDTVRFQHTHGIAVVLSTAITNSGIRNSYFIDIGNRWKTTALAADRGQAIVFCCGTTANNHGNFSENNVFTDIGTDATSATEQHDFLFSRNICSMDNGQLTAVWNNPQPTAFGACFYALSDSAVTVIGNNSDGAQGNAIDTNAVTERTIVGNYITMSGENGIGVYASGNAVVVGNTVKNSAKWPGAAAANGAAGISLSGTLGNVTITGNVIHDDQAGKTQAYGVFGVAGLTATALKIDSSNALAGNATAMFGGTLTSYLPSEMLDDASNAVLPTARTKLHLLSFVSPYDVGAKCDGATDDTTALNTWLNSSSATVGLQLPQATCVFTSALSAANPNDIEISGAGPYQSVLLYKGASQTIDLITIGGLGAQTKNVYLEGFRVDTTTTMTAGAGIRLIRAARSALVNVTPGGQDGNGKLWNGVWFDRVDTVRYSGIDAAAQNDAIRVNGTVGAGDKSGLQLSNGKISGSGVGIHVGGGFGGITTANLDIIANGYNLLVDTALAAEGNREIFVGESTTLDSATTDNVQVNDALASSATFQLCGWIASAGQYGVNVIKWGGALSLCGGPVFNNTSDGIFLQDAGTVLNINYAEQIHANSGYGINASTPITVRAFPQSFYNNALGIKGANITLNTSINVITLSNANSVYTYTPSPGVKLIRMMGCGLGGPGGSGAVEDSTHAASGGAAGSAGECTGPTGIYFAPTDIGASASITIPATPSGAAAITSAIGTPTKGNDGLAGGNLTVVNGSSVTILTLFPGGGGQGGQLGATATSGGGAGICGGGANGSAGGAAGCGGGANGGTGGANNILSILGAPAGGGSGAAGVAGNGGLHLSGGAGGGGGGGGVTGTCTQNNGGAGGRGIGNEPGSSGGTSGAPAGGIDTPTGSFLPGGGGGGGWGGPSATAVAGDGGKGVRGGGGGGGGSTCAAAGTLTSGKGGDGGDAYLIIEEFF